MLETVVSDVSTVVAVADNFADAPDSNRGTGRNLPSVFRKLGKVSFLTDPYLPSAISSNSSRSCSVVNREIDGSASRAADGCDS